MHFGPHTILLTVDIEFKDTLSAKEVEEAFDRLEKSMHSQYPDIKPIYIEDGAVTTRACCSECYLVTPTSSLQGTKLRDIHTLTRRVYECGETRQIAIANTAYYARSVCNIEDSQGIRSIDEDNRKLKTLSTTHW